MSKYDGLQISGGNTGFGVNAKYYENKINALSASIPEQTSTEEEKKQAIRIKKQIIAIYQEQLKTTRNSNPELASSITDKINEIGKEIKVIENEISDMTSIFDE